jgi:hypothetical protein
MYTAVFTTVAIVSNTRTVELRSLSGLAISHANPHPGVVNHHTNGRSGLSQAACAKNMANNTHTVMMTFRLIDSHAYLSQRGVTTVWEQR